MLYNTVSTNYKDDIKKVVMRIIIKTVLKDCMQRASIRKNKTNTHIHTLVYYNELLLKCMLTGILKSICNTDINSDRSIQMKWSQK